MGYVNTKSPQEQERPYIIARNLGLKELHQRAYEDINLDLKKSRLTALCAEKGSGKTELLLSLAGRMRPTSGSLEVAGYALPRQASAVRRLSGLGFFERVNEIERTITAIQALSAELNLFSCYAHREAALAYMRQYDFEPYADCPIHALSRREYLKLGIILGLVGEPKLLVVDDIESGLTRHQSETLLYFLKDLAVARGITVVVGILEYELARQADEVVALTPMTQAQQRKVEEILAKRGER